MTPHPTRTPSGLGRLGTSLVLILLLIGSTLLMHTLAGHAGEHSAPTSAEHSHTDTASQAAETAVTPAGATTFSSDDCGGLCAMLCAIMGMACLMALALFTWALLRRRGTRALFILSKALSAVPALPTITVPRLTPALSQLSILRV